MDLEVVTEVNEDTGPDDEEGDVVDASEDELLKRFDRMAFVVSSSKLAAMPHWVSVTQVFRESSDTGFLKSAGVTQMEDPRYDKYTSRLKQLRAIGDYQYRVNILDSNKSYEEVTEIFVRVNSLGAKLRSSDLALAQITATWRDSLRIFQEFEEDCKKKGFDLGLGIHLKNLVSFATGQSRFGAVAGLGMEELQRGWEDAKQGMNFALNFLQSNVGIDSTALLSSPFVILSIGFYGHFKNYSLTPDEAGLLRYWVLVANAKARYSRGSSETFLDQDLAAIRRGEGIRDLLLLIQTQVGRLEVSPRDLENRNSRSAYFKTMFLAFREDGATDWHDNLAISLKHSGARHSLQFHHIFPRGVLRGRDLSTAKINDICNLSFVSGTTNRKISDKEPAAYLPDVINKQGEAALVKQSIPTNTALWRVAAYDDFLAERRQLVADRLNEFLDHRSVQLRSGGG